MADRGRDPLTTLAWLPRRRQACMPRALARALMGGIGKVPCSIRGYRHFSDNRVYLPSTDCGVAPSGRGYRSA
jgi:hypothetical protein